MMSEPTQLADDAASIRRLVGHEWEAAWKAGDAAAVSEYYAEDAVLFPQNEYPIAGKSAIQSGYERIFAAFNVTGSSEVAELEVAGDWGFMRGSYTTCVAPKEGGRAAENDRGTWLWIVRRQADGSWKIARAMGASGPAPSADGVEMSDEPADEAAAPGA